jgi:hypothetical protein
MAKKTLEEVLQEYFTPSETKTVKGEPEYIITVNGSTIRTPINTKSDLDSTLKSMAIEDARTGRKTKVVVYKLEGEAAVTFPTEVVVGTTENTTEEGEE